MEVCGVRYCVGQGNNIRFWHDVWCGEEPFFLRFQNIFRFAVLKEDTVVDHMSMDANGINWNLQVCRRNIISEGVKQFLSMHSLILFLLLILGMGMTLGIGSGLRKKLLQSNPFIDNYSKPVEMVLRLLLHFNMRSFGRNGLHLYTIYGFTTFMWRLLPYAVIWGVWNARNNLIFRDGTLCIGNIIQAIKGIIWFWMGVHKDKKQFTFADFMFNWDALIASR
ncbi:hypothetical protein IFM89_001531 [Coptis chinensis]|uniref:Uncharacterized protein n=1 Tax=Coptis chinensis TaxID=261450 RepID=A0A835LUD6_9MAGN|nr:hypothetical protein IFM89_001531 [Coptis chinensis]